MNRWAVTVLLFISVAGLAVAKGDTSKAATQKSVVRVHFSGNFEGEIEPCGCKIPKGGLSRRSAFLNENRTDSTANLTLEVGSFAPPPNGYADSIKAESLLNFYRMKNYDAVGLGSREFMFGMAEWQDAANEGIPIVAANLFRDKGNKKPLFTQFVSKTEKGVRLAAIGFVTEAAWNSRRDTTIRASFKSPFEMRKLVEKVARRADHLTLFGEFTIQEADSLAAIYPEANLIIAGGIRTGDRPKEVGNTVIVGTQTRGYHANYVEWNFVVTDSVPRYRSAQATLDPSVPDDSTVARLVADTKLKMMTPATPKSNP